MQWTDERQIHLHTILHQNKGDENARGHIGTELNNKAETIIQVEKDKNNHDISCVEAIHIRAMEFKPFAFRINEEALSELVEDYIKPEGNVGRPKKEPFDPYHEISETTHRNALSMAFANGSISKYVVLIDALQKAYEQAGCKLNYNKAVALKTFLQNKRMIVNENKVYSFKSDFYY